MANLTSADLDMIVDKTICCAGTLAYTAAKEFSYGLKCANDTLTKVKLLNAYIEILSDYEIINTTETVATGTVTIAGTAGSAQLQVGGQAISSVITFTASLSNTAGLLAADINTYTSGMIDYTAVQTLGTGKLTISTVAGSGSIPNDRKITATLTGDMSIPGTASTLVMAGGKTKIESGDSVITEIEALLIIEKIGELCDLCFPPPGSTYI